MDVHLLGIRFFPRRFVSTPLFVTVITVLLGLATTLPIKAQSTCPENPANPVVAENCLEGTTDWMMNNFLNDVEGFASSDSVNIGEEVHLYVNTTAPTVSLKIFRSGYYGGTGGRLIREINNVSGKIQPECIFAADTGLRSCANWVASYTLKIPADWVSGIYVVKLTRPDTGGENYIQFVVRNDDYDSAILYQQSTTTNAAYNFYGGKSLYDYNSNNVCLTVADSQRAVKTSLFRPEAHLGWSHHDFYKNTYFHSEYPMVRWLEQQGYDVTYSTNMDTHRSGKPGAHNELLDHQVFLSVGHDEYWSQPMRDALTAARDAGVHLGFFTANTGYWRIRFEPDPITNVPDSVMVSYKSTESGSPDPSGEPTGTWRDPVGANDPENALMGVMYIGDLTRLYFPLRLSSEFTADPLFRHTGLQDLPENSYLDVGDQIIGWEWDAPADNGVSPDGLTVLAKTPMYGFRLQDAGRYKNGNLGLSDATTTYYVAPSGAIVFASGTIQWSWGLGAQGVQIVPADPYIAQVTYNLLADMGQQPATPSEELILDGSDTPDRPLPTERIRTVGEAVPPAISDIQVTADDTTFTVNWKTDVEATGQLWYGTDPDHLINAVLTEKVLVREHSHTAQYLVSGRTYYFKVVSANAEWAFTISDGGTITTPTSSITQRLRTTFGPLAQQGNCWIRANRTGAIIIGVLGVVIVVLLIAPFVIMRRRRKARALRAA
ncbi:MAG: fibronectin type III domain-containing protein [Anaerolineae bacterium]|nr:fibronectin type III domain-containing protein [Anaerolineae bacterium]